MNFTFLSIFCKIYLLSFYILRDLSLVILRYEFSDPQINKDVYYMEEKNNNYEMEPFELRTIFINPMRRSLYFQKVYSNRFFLKLKFFERNVYVRK